MSFGSSRTPRPFATHVRATVKWYNPTKGFGFVTPNDGSADVFLHVSVVEQAGLQGLDEGAILVCDLADGQKGAQVSTIHSVEAGSVPAQRSSRPTTGSRYPRQSVNDYDDDGYGAKPSRGGTVEGTVKWLWLSNRAPLVKFFLAKQISARAAASSWRELAAAER